jgi:hypothetical protein
MFGFIRPKNRDLKTAKPAVQPSGILVTREDIYRENKGLEPILLLRKGYEVTAEELPRFIRNGAKPHQFQLKHAAEPVVAAYQAPQKLPKPPVPAPMLVRRHKPLPVLSGSVSPIPQTANRNRALILDPDPKSMKRLIDCLFICGIQLDRIHPVRMAEHLSWVGQKYRPHILVVDYELPGFPQTGLDILMNLHQMPWLECCILTLNPQQPLLSQEEKQSIKAFCREKNIKILEKPVNRHTLSRLLTE